MPDPMSITSKQNEPNPLFKKWLQELFEEAKAKNSKLTNLLEEALNSISNYTEPLKSGAECAILKGFAKQLCLFLDQRLEVYYLNMKYEEFTRSNECSEANSQINMTNGDNSNKIVENIQIVTENKENIIDTPKANSQLNMANGDNSNMMVENVQTVTENKENIMDILKANSQLNLTNGDNSDMIVEHVQIVTENTPNVVVVHNNNNMENNLNAQQNNVKLKKPYRPAFMTGAYAILVTLLNNMKQNPNNISLTKEELIVKAQPYSDESLIRAKPDPFYRFWLSMRKLLTRELVIKIQSKKPEFKLSDAGTKLAEELLKEYGGFHAKKVIDLVPCSNDIILSKDKQEICGVEVWIQDHQDVMGPLSLQIHRGATLAELRKQAEISLDIPIHSQQWIVGQTFCSDDSASIQSLAGPDLCIPFQLCLVGADAKKDDTKVSTIQQPTEQNPTTDTNDSVYHELKLLERCALIPNTENFECGVCIVEYSAGEGVVLKECVHTFCRECLSAAVKHCEDPEVACPAAGCTGFLQEREIRALVSPEEYERWLARRLAVAESVSRHSFHCKTPDCTGWALCEPGVLIFPCPVCKHTNCVPCEAIHEGKTCDQHRVNTAIDSLNDKGTKILLNNLIERGKALACPECHTIIIKQLGCDWILCSACKTEICWVTRGRRWGPRGRGDTSGGCRCRVNRKKCHPSCRDCH